MTFKITPKEKRYIIAMDMLEKYEISKRYKVKFVDYREWDRIRKIHYAKQIERRRAKEQSYV